MIFTLAILKTKPRSMVEPGTAVVWKLFLAGQGSLAALLSMSFNVLSSASDTNIIIFFSISASDPAPIHFSLPDPDPFHETVPNTNPGRIAENLPKIMENS